MGFTEPSGSPRMLVRSYRTVSPLPVQRTDLCRPARRHRRSALCCTFLRVTPTGRYPASCPAESGRSSDGSPLRRAGPYAATRPTRHRCPFHHSNDIRGLPESRCADRRHRRLRALMVERRGGGYGWAHRPWSGVEKLNRGDDVRYEEAREVDRDAVAEHDSHDGHVLDVGGHRVGGYL